MGVSLPSLPSLSFSLLCVLLPVAADSGDDPSPPVVAATEPERQDVPPFKPSIAVIVGLLTTVFSLTFLLLLYVKHCKRGSTGGVGAYPTGQHYLGPHSTVSLGRKNSGIDRAVIESLPVFRFESLKGQKEGLECAVCLARFEAAEVLRLLPKCKHAFHVECVDTWLDAHSTCPLCRYRVDPEDVLLVDHHHIVPPPRPVMEEQHVVVVNEEPLGYRRISGRHSSAGERGSGGGILQFLQQKRKTAATAAGGPAQDSATSFRRSLDSAGLKKKNGQSVTVSCFDRGGLRKDGLLLTNERPARTDTTAEERRRLEHRIIVSTSTAAERQRWSDVQPSDLLYLRSEMIISDGRRLSGGRNVMNGRSVSEITGLSRFSEQGQGGVIRESGVRALIKAGHYVQPAGKV